MTINGTTPTSAVGLLIFVGQLVTLSRSEWVNAKFIRVTADASIQGIQERAA